MAQRIYTDHGIVLVKEGVGETSLSALILTGSYGLLRVRAQGARAGKGKLKTALEPMTLGEYSFVSGRFGARLVGAEATEHLLPREMHAGRRALGNIARLLIRLLPGEESHKELFSSVVEGFTYMREASQEEIAHAECALVLRILRALGYLPEDPQLIRLTESSLSPELLAEVAGAKSHLIRTINQALSSTGL